MESTGADLAPDSQLKQRKVQSNLASAREGNNGADEPERTRKTYGRIPDGTTFIVPQTHDMVSQLFSPSQPKNVSDAVVVLILALHIAGIYLLPPAHRAQTCAALFIFWRACYNGGIGFLLHLQSTHGKLVAYARQSGFFLDPQSGKNPHPWLFRLLKREMETKIPKDYTLEKAPIEYNTWLVFRRLVDIILLCDFVSYCLYAIVCMGTPPGEATFITVGRWSVGIGLFFFNLWVKLDAHRVVKDYAWYWGDFFYLIDQELTFDGVFEMAPHPMYSIGYAGYYGISLMAASYRVLFISILGHAAQFAFLLLVENPHIEKTYNPPPPLKRKANENEALIMKSDDASVRDPSPTSAVQEIDPTSPPVIHKLIGLKNIDFHRVTDASVAVIVFYFGVFSFLTPTNKLFQTFFVLNAAIWRLWYSVGIGYILNRQSNKRQWTRHFLKYGGSMDEAWREWKGIYHISLILCHASFVAAAWKMYQLPADWRHGMPILKHVVGASLIALQTWTSVSIYESLGEFGWFFGDFFYPNQQPKLTYNGIYRYLNNPERYIGLAGVWGAALITRSSTIFCLALLSHLLTVAFLEFIERPHMQKLYGQKLRQESGLTKSLKRSLPWQIVQWQGSVDKMLEETFDSMEDLIDAAMPKIAAGVNVFVKDSTQMFKHPTRISISRISSDLAGFDPKDYSLTILNATNELQGQANGQINPKPLTFEYGQTIRVRWTAPLNHSKSDWIGLYKVAENVSREVTKVRSQGRWVPTNRDQYGSIVTDQGCLISDQRVSGQERTDGENKDFFEGTVEFSGDKLFWSTGVFELRYHHDGKYNVMAISIPFVVSIEKFEEADAVSNGSSTSSSMLRAATEKAVLGLVCNSLDRDPDFAPSTVDESFGGLVERDGKYARRVVYGIQKMFGIEFAPEVVKADGTVRNLAWRVCNARKVLQQFSSLSTGRTSPIDSKY